MTRRKTSACLRTAILDLLLLKNRLQNAEMKAVINMNFESQLMRTSFFPLTIVTNKVMHTIIVQDLMQIVLEGRMVVGERFQNLSVSGSFDAIFFVVDFS